MINFKRFIKQTKSANNKIPSVPNVVHGTHAHVKLRKPLNLSVKENTENTTNSFLNSIENSHLHPENKYDSKKESLEHIERILQDRHPHSSLRPKEAQHIYDYTGGESQDFNRHLIDQYKNGSTDIDPRYQEMHKHIISAIKRHNLPKMTTFCGVGFNPRNLGKPTADGGHIAFHIPAITSTSPDQDIAYRFAGSDSQEDNDKDIKHILRIHVPGGHKGYYIGNSDVKSENPYEQELLLLPKTYKVRSTPTIFHDGSGGQTHVWEAHPVPALEDVDTWKPPK